MEERRDERDARPLDEHGEGDDDEDDSVDPVRLVDVLQEREGAEQDRHGALEAAPEDEDALAVAEARRPEERRDDERPGDEGE